MELKIYRWRTNSAAGPGQWEYGVIDIDWWGGDESFRGEKAQELHQQNNWNDKYRGCEIEEATELPEGWLTRQITSLKRQVAYTQVKLAHLEQMK